MIDTTLGVILCGGQSIRMGTDKGLLKMQSDNWAQTAANKMTALALPVVFSVNENQYGAYAAVFAPGLLVKDNDSIHVKGPLRGILSVHTQYPEKDLFVLACDMPLMTTPVLKQLLSCYKTESAEAFAYTNDGSPEPLCSIWCAQGLSHILQLQKNNQLQKHSMKYMLTQIKTVLFPLADDQKKYFENFNTPAALNGL